MLVATKRSRHASKRQPEGSMGADVTRRVALQCLKEGHPMPELPKQPWVAYVVPFPFPWGEAGSRRVVGISKSIAASGRDVVVVAYPGDDSRPGQWRTVATDSVTGATVRTVTRDALPTGTVRRQFTHHRVGIADALHLLDSLRPLRPSHLVTYGTLTTPLAQALRWGRRRGVSILVDVVERYAAQQFSGGILAPGYLSASAGFATLARRADGVIAISRHLERHFAERGVPTLRVPPTLDVVGTPIGRPRANFAFGYFGNPGRKDRLDLIVEAFRDVRRATCRDDLQLVVAGQGTEGLLAPRGVEGLELRGRVPQRDVASLVGSLAATVLVRPPARYADAGFPTKVVESLAVGTPVICNLTSDLADVVREGETGWVTPTPTVLDVAEAMSRAVTTPPDDFARMRQRARDVAMANFNTSNYVNSIDRFLTSSQI